MKKIRLALSLLLVSLTLSTFMISVPPAAAQGQQSEKETLFKQFNDKRRAEKEEAYRLAQSYLEKFGKDTDENTSYVREWAAAYQSVARKADGEGTASSSQSSSQTPVAGVGSAPDLSNTTWQMAGGEEGKKWAEIFTFRPGGRFQWESFLPDGRTKVLAGTWRRVGTDIFASLLNADGNPTAAVQATLKAGVLSGVVKRDGNDVLKFRMRSEDFAGSLETSTNDPSPLAELEHWNRIKESTSAIDYGNFIKKFPDGAFADAAKAKMDSLGDPVWNKVKISQDPFVFRDFIKNNPNNPFIEEAKQMLSKLAAEEIAWEQSKQSKNPDELLMFFRSYPNHPKAKEAYNLASELTWSKIKDSKNLKDFDNYIERFPDGAYVEEANKRNPRRFYRLAFSDPKPAISEATRTLKDNPKSLEALSQRAYAYDIDGQEDLKIADANKMLELLPSPTTAEDFGFKCLAQKYKKKSDEALISCNKVIELNPLWISEAYSSRGGVYFQKEKYDLAIADYSKAIELNKEGFGGYLARASSFVQKKKYELAERDIKIAMEIELSAEAYLYRAILYMAQEAFVPALDDLARAIALAPGNRLLYNVRGIVYYRQALKIDKEYRVEIREKAAADFTKAIELSPNFANAYFSRSMTYSLLDKNELSKADMKKYNELAKREKELFK